MRLFVAIVGLALFAGLAPAGDYRRPIVVEEVRFRSRPIVVEEVRLFRSRPVGVERIEIERRRGLFGRRVETIEVQQFRR